MLPNDCKLKRLSLKYNMLFITFKLGEANYALEARQVIEVVPLVTLRACSGAPAYIAGLANYRGTGVPIVDLGRLVGGSALCNIFEHPDHFDAL